MEHLDNAALVDIKIEICAKKLHSKIFGGQSPAQPITNQLAVQ